MDQGLKISYLGQCGFLLDFGHTRVVTDPYLSDYVDQAASTADWAWRRRYRPPTDLAALSPDLVLISHAHEDHMDPWTIGAYLRSGGKARFVCPAPEAGRLKAMGAADVIGARAEEPLCFGEVRVTPIACAHTEFHRDASGNYHELSYLIEGRGMCLLFGGDMSLYPGLEERLRAARPSLLLLPVNGRDELRTARGIIGNLTSGEAAGLAARLGAPFVPMHHDLYENNGCPMEEVERSALDAGALLRPLGPLQRLEPAPWPKVCVLGAGLSGRGFLARLLCGQAHITLIDEDRQLVDRLRQAGAFRVSGFDGRPIRTVGGYRALHTDDDACRQALDDCDVILSCVRAENAPRAGRWLQSVCRQKKPVVACENALDPAATLRLEDGWQVSSAAIFCTTVAGAGLDILSEDLDALVLSRERAPQALTGLSGFTLEPDFRQLMMRKIYTYNAASAIIAYLGAEKGYEQYSQAANDPDIDRELGLFYNAVNRSICEEYGVAPEAQERFAQRSRAKFQNPHILDSVARNASSPERKLSAHERIIAPALLILRHGGDVSPLIRAAAAALRYAGCDREGAEQLLTGASGLTRDEPLFKAILERFDGTGHPNA